MTVFVCFTDDEVGVELVGDEPGVHAVDLDLRQRGSDLVGVV
jgi:hypothetical protein